MPNSPNGKANLWVSGVKWEKASVLTLLPLIDCVPGCKLCCTEPHPIAVQEWEVERIAKRLEKRSGVVKRSLKPIGEWEWTLARPCSFLVDEEWHCSIYDDRPVVCKYYPLERIWMPQQEEYVIGVDTSWCKAGQRCIEQLKAWVSLVSA